MAFEHKFCLNDESDRKNEISRGIPARREGNVHNKHHQSLRKPSSRENSLQQRSSPTKFILVNEELTHVGQVDWQTY